MATLREKLDTGKKPRVMLLVDTALGPAGTSVPIVSFGEPAIGEFISVKLGGDVVPFSPAELSIPVRGRPGATTLPLDPPPGPQPVATPARPYKPAKTEDTPPPARLVAVPEPAPQLPVATAPAAAPASAEPAAPAKAASRKPARGGMSVTMRFNGQTWTYESTRGGRKSAARPLNLAAVRGFTDRLDDPALRRDMQVAIDACRQQAQSRADALRAELERVEVELAELDE